MQRKTARFVSIEGSVVDLRFINGYNQDWNTRLIYQEVA